MMSFGAVGVYGWTCQRNQTVVIKLTADNFAHQFHPFSFIQIEQYQATVITHSVALSLDLLLFDNQMSHFCVHPQNNPTLPHLLQPPLPSCLVRINRRSRAARGKKTKSPAPRGRARARAPLPASEALQTSRMTSYRQRSSLLLKKRRRRSQRCPLPRWKRSPPLLYVFRSSSPTCWQGWAW